jgi:GTPase SAR1 family protein
VLVRRVLHWGQGHRHDGGADVLAYVRRDTAFLTQKCRLEDKVIKFEIWDTAGQERFHR